MTIDYNVIGQRIKEARLEKNITQEELADKLDLSVTYISRVENGNSHINLNRLSQVCNVLEISEGTLLNGVYNKSENYLNKEFADLLKNTTPKKQKLIYEMAKTIAKMDLE